MPIIIALFLLLLPANILAVKKESPRFQLEDEVIKLESEDNKQIIISDQNSPTTTSDPLFEKNGIRITYGYPHLSENQPLSVKISRSIVSFEPQETDDSNQDVLLTYGSGALSYTASMIQNHDLKKLNGTTIKKTTCDKQCTGYNAAEWRSANVDGLGYNISANDRPEDFINENYYRPLIDSSSTPYPIIMKGVNTHSNRTSRIKLKLNLSDSSDGGTYENVITIIILPGY